jgi:hypothetical protein
MKFTKLRFNGLTVVDFPIIGAKPQDVYICKSVDGLGPTEIDVSIADTLNAGGYFQGRHFHNRQIVALIGLNPNYSTGMTAEELRTNLYGLLTADIDGTLTVSVVDIEEVLASTVGYISKMEINPFTDTPEVQITVETTSPFLKAPDELFIEPDDKDAPIIDNVGTALSGFYMGLTFTADTAGWTLTHSSGRKMEFNFAFETGDLLEFDTRPGHRGIWVTRDAVRSNIIYTLTSDSVWFMLHGGANLFASSSSSFDWGDVFYLPQFWGI